MWPTASVWGNALIFAAAGYALILSAVLGQMLGQFARGRTALKWAPVALAVAIACYTGVALLMMPTVAPKRCIYNVEHPSDC